MNRYISATFSPEAGRGTFNCDDVVAFLQNSVRDWSIEVVPPLNLKRVKKTYPTVKSLATDH